MLLECKLACSLFGHIHVYPLLKDITDLVVLVEIHLLFVNQVSQVIIRVV